jgi:hypothetical protein
MVLASPPKNMFSIPLSNWGMLKENEFDLTLVINKRKVKRKIEKRFCGARSIVLELAMVVMLGMMMLRAKGLIHLYIGFCV